MRLTSAVPAIIALLLAVACAHPQPGPAAPPGAPAASVVAVEPAPATPAGPAHLDDLSQWNGDWRFEYFTLARVSPTTTDQAKANIGKVAHIKDRRVTFEGVDCVVHRAESNQLPTESYVASRYNLARKDLNLPDPTISVVTTDCDGTPFAEFVVHHGELLFFVDGVVYNLRQVEPGK